MINGRWGGREINYVSGCVLMLIVGAMASEPHFSHVYGGS